MMHIIRITENCSIPSAKRTCERTIGKIAGGKKVYAYEVLRSDYESIDVQTGKINGSFDVDLGKVSGGGILSSHSLVEFEAAGVEVIGCSRWFSMT